MNEIKTETAQSVRCENCGSAISITSLNSHVTCKSCGQLQEVDPVLLSKLGQFSAEVNIHSEDAKSDREIAGAWEQTAVQMKAGSGAGQVFLALLLMIGIPMGLVLLGLFMLQSGIIGQENVLAVNAMAMVGTVIGVVGYLLLYYSRKKKQGATSLKIETTIRCPECGGANTISGANGFTTCSHCGAGLLPEAGARANILDAATNDKRLAKMTKLKAERSGYAAISGVGMSPIAMIWMIGGSFLLMMSGGTIGFSYQMATGDEPYHPAVLMLWIITFGLAGGMVAATKYIKAKKQNSKTAMDELAMAFGGEVLEDISAAVTWFNRYWISPIHHYYMFPGSYYSAAQMNIAGFPIFVDINPVAASQHHKAYASILLAAHIPGITENQTTAPPIPKPAEQIIQRLEAAGFTIKLTEAGIEARADKYLLKNLKKSRDYTILSEPIAHIARLSKALNATPVTGI
ncbi:MAG: hypothetical protein JXR91_05115 [Deltaproteobacteria bacterium]|nr:hypothetical protein [Deltaproteobacteria bacterium]